MPGISCIGPWYFVPWFLFCLVWAYLTQWPVTGWVGLNFLRPDVILGWPDFKCWSGGFRLALPGPTHCQLYSEWAPTSTPEAIEGISHQYHRKAISIPHTVDKTITHLATTTYPSRSQSYHHEQPIFLQEVFEWGENHRGCHRKPSADTIITKTKSRLEGERGNHSGSSYGGGPPTKNN